MHRSSETIGAFAAALAKAQAELTNPEKSLTATIRSPFPREGDRTFRYASLSSGLDIVRKCLGRHEIAAVQTTTIDTETSLIRLTTMLAHSSGEWVSSDWPVCPVSETSAPHRLGAALTYARRYALFTLVGIAGEDDTDAPDLPEPSKVPETPDRRISGKTPDGAGTRNGKLSHVTRKPVLSASESAASRDRMLMELSRLNSPGELAEWARVALPSKNALTASDAHLIEDAFASRLVTHSAPDQEQPPATETVDAASLPTSEKRRRAGRNKSMPQTPSAEGIDKSVLAIPEPRRIRDKEHLRFVSRQPCLICGREPSDAHHIRFAQPRALGRKVSDEFTVPLCRSHHRDLHKVGDEAAWWKGFDINALAFAERLWHESHGRGRLSSVADRIVDGFNDSNLTTVSVSPPRAETNSS